MSWRVTPVPPASPARNRILSWVVIRQDKSWIRHCFMPSRAAIWWAATTGWEMLACCGNAVPARLSARPRIPSGMVITNGRL